MNRAKRVQEAHRGHATLWVDQKIDKKSMSKGGLGVMLGTSGVSFGAWEIIFEGLGSYF